MNQTEFLIKYIEWIAVYAPVWGFLIIFLLMILESSFIPFPSEIVMIPAGFLAYRGDLSFGHPIVDVIVAIILGTAGSMVGAYVNYYIALLLGRPILHKYGKYFFIKPVMLDRAEEIFVKYGEVTTFICRLLPGIRQLISLPAGLSRMKHKSFILYTVLGAGVWTTFLTFIGYYLGSVSQGMSYPELVHEGTEIITRNYIWIFLALIVIVIAYIYVHKKIMHVSSDEQKA